MLLFWIPVFIMVAFIVFIIRRSESQFNEMMAADVDKATWAIMMKNWEHDTCVNILCAFSAIICICGIIILQLVSWSTI